MNNYNIQHCSKTAGHKLAQHKNETMKMNINSNGAAASNGNNNSNVVRKAFGGFSKPQIIAEGDHAGVIVGNLEEITGTEAGEAVNRIELTVTVESQGAKCTLKRSYNMSENGRGAAQLIND